MAFADHLTTEKPKCGAKSLVEVALAKMDPKEAAAARQLLASPQSDALVARAFCDEGYQLGWNSVRNYRLWNGVGRFAP